MREDPANGGWATVNSAVRQRAIALERWVLVPPFLGRAPFSRSRAGRRESLTGLPHLLFSDFPVINLGMARIIYAASGDGLGHATRAHSVGDGLMARGHEVRFVSSLMGSQYLRDVYNGLTTEVAGFRLTYDHGRVRTVRTLWDIARSAVGRIRPTLTQLNRLFREFQPDLLITDSEVFTPNVARRLGVPFVSLDNQHLLTHCDVELPPGCRRHFLQAYAFIRSIHGGARRYLISTFVRAPIRHQPTTLLPPIVRAEAYRMKARRGDYLVAYLGASRQHEPMRQALEAFRSFPVRAYGFGHSGESCGVTYKPTNPSGFLEDIAGCAGVVATAGHSLVGECLHFRKPMLLVPYAGQFEQMFNAYHVERLGFGRSASELSPPVLNDFVAGLERFREALTRLPRADLTPILDAVENEL